MLTRIVLSLSLLATFPVVAILAPSGVFAQDDDADPPDNGKKKAKTRKIDKDSPEAQALAELLQVPANYGKKDKRVDLLYSFNEEAQMEDFSLAGFDRQEVSSGVHLAAGSQREGLMMHTLHLKGDYEVEFELKIDRVAPSSVLVFVLGNGKSGGFWGSGWCKRSSRGGFNPVSSRVARGIGATRARFLGNNRTMKIKYTVKNGQVSCTINGAKAGSTKKLKKKLTGGVGVYMHNVSIYLNRLSIKGEIDPKKL